MAHEQLPLSDAKAKIRDIFAAALDCNSSADVKEYLDEVCQGELQLRQEIDELLQAYYESSPFLDETPTSSCQGTKVDSVDLSG